MGQILTDEQVEESMSFADGAMAAAGHFVNSPESDSDIRQALRGEITFDEMASRALDRAKR